ncbi:MAG: cation transporter, partial [Chloroflexi bacterium]|nr:cation transporter [Chloroflexota bacterium]
MIETALGQTATEALDPVCGMSISPDTAYATRHYEGTAIYLCSAACLKKFDAEPDKYLAVLEGSAHGQSPFGSVNLGTIGANTGAKIRESINLPVTGLGRGGAVALEQALEATPGVLRVNANPGQSRVHIEYDEDQATVGRLVQAVRNTGMGVGAASLRLKIEGIYCSACVSQIETALKATPGVLDATLNAATEEARVEYLPGSADLAALARAVQTAGPYRATLAREVSAKGQDKEVSEQDQEYRRLMRKWWFGAAVGVPTMIFSYPYIFPVLQDILPRGSVQLRIVWMLMGLASLAVMVYSGSQFYTGMWEGLKRRSANMHTLIAVGTGVAWLYSTIALLFPQLFPGEEFTDVYY